MGLCCLETFPFSFAICRLTQQSGLFWNEACTQRQAFAEMLVLVILRWRLKKYTANGKDLFTSFWTFWLHVHMQWRGKHFPVTRETKGATAEARYPVAQGWSRVATASGKHSWLFWWLRRQRGTRRSWVLVQARHGWRNGWTVLSSACSPPKTPYWQTNGTICTRSRAATYDHWRVPAAHWTFVTWFMLWSSIGSRTTWSGLISWIGLQ